MTIGIILALVAMLAWGVGDFFVEKSTRKVGDWETLFIISLIGSIILLPFIYKQLPQLFSFDREFYALFIVSTTLLIATLLGFEALKEGKIAVVDPLYALEIPIAGSLAFIILGESVKFYQIILIAILTTGLILISVKPNCLLKKTWLEKGVMFAVFGSVFMGISSFLIGFSSREINPLVTTWFFSLFMMISCLIYLIDKRRLNHLIEDIFKNPRFMFLAGLSDNIAWIAYAFALSLAPMAITVALVESSIIINVLLGLFINKEKIYSHQKIGLILAIVSAIILSATTGA